MAKVIRLATEWLHTLFSLYWNYGKEGREAMSRVKLKTDDTLQAALKASKAACTLIRPPRPVLMKLRLPIGESALFDGFAHFRHNDLIKM